MFDEALNLIIDAAKEFGRDIDADAVREAVKTQARLLAAAYGEPGYRRALISARNTVALAAGIDAVEAGDLADARIRGVIEGVLGIAAKVMGGLI